MTYQQRILKRSLELKFLRDQFPEQIPFWLENFHVRDHHYQLYFHFYEGKLLNCHFKRMGLVNPVIEAFLDVTLELLHDKSLKLMNILSVREIENFLRDSNDVPAIDDQFLLVELDKLLEKVKNNVYNLARVKTADSSLDFTQVSFRELKLVEQILAVEAILDRFIRPTLLQDQGNVELLALEEMNLILSFQGACGTCPSSTTGTLDFVLRTLKAELKEESLTIVLEN